MSEFVHLVSRIVNLAQIREFTFENWDTTIHWNNGETTTLADMDACLLLEALEQRYGLRTTALASRCMNEKAIKFWTKENPVSQSDL